MHHDFLRKKECKNGRYYGSKKGYGDIGDIIA